MSEVVKCHNVTKIYETGTQRVVALWNANFTIESGEFVAIMGPSGSGKSTCMNILGCLDVATEGDYFLDGVNVGRMTKREQAAVRNNKLGFVFQGFNLLARTTARENVELPLVYAKIDTKERCQRALHALEQVGLADRSKHYPNQLSGGQQQRVAIARALVNSPSIIMADEPTGNLDSATSNEILDVFQKLNNSGITIIMVTHELEIGLHARRQLLFRDGKIINDIATSRDNT